MKFVDDDDDYYYYCKCSLYNNKHIQNDVVSSNLSFNCRGEVQYQSIVNSM